MDNVEKKLDLVIAAIGDVKTDVAVLRNEQKNTNKVVEAAMKAAEVNAQNVVKLDERLDKVEQWRSNLAGKLAVIGALGIPTFSFIANWLYKQVDK